MMMMVISQVPPHATTAELRTEWATVHVRGCTGTTINTSKQASIV